MAKAAASKLKTENESLEKNTLEWVVFIISLLLLLSLLTYLVYQSISKETSTPDLKVTYEKDPSPNNPYRYRIMVENTGGETAEDISIEAGIIKNGTLSYKSMLQVSFSPKRSTREGWINFPVDPGTDSIYVQVVSYKKP